MHVYTYMHTWMHAYAYYVIYIDLDMYIDILCIAHCSLLELTKCVIEPSTRPRVTCNSETIACHCPLRWSCTYV